MPHAGTIFRPGKTISMNHNSQVQTWTRAMYDAVMAYRWASPRDGRAFLGWIVTSFNRRGITVPPYDMDIGAGRIGQDLFIDPGAGKGIG